MPTGYTAYIGEGANFQQFAMRCARAFGALIEMRDDPADAPIRESAPSDYHTKELEKDRAELERINSLSEEQIAEECEKENQGMLARNKKWNDEKDVLRAKYEAVLKEAELWEPPTDQHVGLKEFMIKQIKESIDFDCSHYAADTIISPTEWKVKMLEKITKSISYHTVEHEKDVQRCKERNRWVKDLQESLTNSPR